MDEKDKTTDEKLASLVGREITLYLPKGWVLGTLDAADGCWRVSRQYRVFPRVLETELCLEIHFCTHEVWGLDAETRKIWLS